MNKRTPYGCVHEQDNAKLGTRAGQTVTFVHEVVANTYVRSAQVDGPDAGDPRHFRCKG